WTCRHPSSRTLRPAISGVHSNWGGSELADTFGFVGEHLLAESPEFRQGEALFAGGFITTPTFTRMGARITEEGGADVGVPLLA
ncbi:hypothetical protein RD149_24230, partial [Gordonia westfalica]|nr:hypothetical protein [Gordonia westfalica]